MRLVIEGVGKVYKGNVWGLREFSMYPGRLLEVKQIVRSTDIPSAQAALRQWLEDAEEQSGGSLLDALDESQR